ncbi:hypothetical protein BS78_02G047600 [Paspalum vaginatum]|nr:hypothetical protein BS78_02G047600 [Paspalum vaginatum]
MSLPSHRSLGDEATVEGPTPPPQRVESAVSSSWEPLPRSFLHRRRVATAAPPEAADPDGPRRTERMTWPPARPRVHSLRGRWVGSPAAPPRRDAGADAIAIANAPPSSSSAAASTARVPHSRRSVGPFASTPSTPASTARVPPPSQRCAGPSARLQAQHQASSADSPLGSAPPRRSALATRGGGAAPTKAPATRSGARRPPAPTIEPSAGTPGPGAPSPRRKRKLPTGSPGVSSPRPRPKTKRPPTGSTGALPAPRINLPPSPLLRLAAPPLLQPQLAASGHGTIEVLFNLNYGHLGYTGLVLLGLYAGLKDQMSGWSAASKILYLALMILGASSLGAGLMAASSVAPTGYTRRVSSVCSRLCTCLATFVFVVALACQMGSHGYIAGVVLGAAAVGYMLSVWVEGDPAAYGSYSWVRTAVRHLWQCFKWSGRRGPLLP